jgi:hypothetical protein
MTQPDQKPGEGVPRLGVHVAVAVRQWTIAKLIDYRKANNLNTSIIGDLDHDTLSVQFRALPEDPKCECIALVIECDTIHGGHFNQSIPWTPDFVGVGSVVLQIVQAAGGVVHS